MMRPDRLKGTPIMPKWFQRSFDKLLPGFPQQPCPLTGIIKAGVVSKPVLAPHLSMTPHDRHGYM